MENKNGTSFSLTSLHQPPREFDVLTRFLRFSRHLHILVYISKYICILFRKGMGGGWNGFHQLSNLSTFIFLASTLFNSILSLHGAANDRIVIEMRFKCLEKKRPTKGSTAKERISPRNREEFHLQTKVCTYLRIFNRARRDVGVWFKKIFLPTSIRHPFHHSYIHDKTEWSVGVGAGWGKIVRLSLKFRRVA